MTSQEDKVYSSVDYTLIRRLLAFVKPYRASLYIVFLFTAIAAGMAPLRPFLTKLGIDSYIMEKDEQGLMMMVGIILCVLIIHAGLQYFTSIMLQRIGQKVLYNVRMEVFNHIQSLSLRSYDTMPVGRLVTRVTNDIEALNELFTSGVVTIFSDILLIIFQQLKK